MSSLTALAILMVIFILTPENNAWFTKSQNGAQVTKDWKVVRPKSYHFSDCTKSYSDTKYYDDDTAKRSQNKCGREVSQDFNDYDKNGDAQISLKEFSSATKCKAREVLRGFLEADKNGDKVIDNVEFVFLPFITQDKAVDINGNVEEFIQDAVLQAELDGRKEVIIKLKKDPEPEDSQSKSEEAGPESEEVGSESEEVGPESEEVGSESEEVGSESEEVGTESEKVGSEEAGPESEEAGPESEEAGPEETDPESEEANVKEQKREEEDLDEYF